MSFRSLWRVVLGVFAWRWRFVLLIAFSFFAGAFYYAQQLRDLYEATAIVSLLPRPDIAIEGDDAVEVLVPQYAEFVSSPATIRDVATDLGLRPGTIEENLAVTTELESGNIEITVRQRTSSAAALAANGLARAIVDRGAEDPLARAELTARAFGEPEPVAPPRGSLYLATLAVGLILGTIVAALLEMRRPRLRKPADFANASGYRVIGLVPSSRALRNRQRYAFGDPHVGAAIRNLRTNLQRARSPHETATVSVVAAPTGGQGASTIAALLAEGIARVGTSVLLVDADLRRPSIARRFKLDSERSLSAALRGTVSFEHAMKKGWVDGLAVMTTKTDPEAADLVSTRLPAILDAARERFESVIIDVPPLLGGSDARTIATFADEIVLVARAGADTGSLQEAVFSFEGLGTPIRGAVANGLPGAEDGAASGP